MKTVAIIPARSGSKGLPKKNIKLIAGKPLIAWSIEHARMSKLIDEVYVSTDCSNIAEVSKNYGANVPFLRPDNISNDFSTTESVVDHFCDFLHNKQSNYENILLVQCTSPIRAKNRFDDAINNFSTRKLDSLVPVSQTHRFLWKNFDQPCPSYDFERRPRRQDLIGSEKQFVETGSFYLFKRF